MDTIRLFLADDDKDDCFLFKEALEEMDLRVQLTTVHDGEQLMKLLNEKGVEPPSLLFLDLNMPRKNGFECLVEIKQSDRLKDIPIIIYSTSFDPEMVNQLYAKGAHFYIRKPSEFSKLKLGIRNAIEAGMLHKNRQPAQEDFILHA